MSFTSKFRHIYGESARQKDQYSDIKGALTSGESQYIKANAKFWAFGKSTGGAPLFVRKLSDVGRSKLGAKYISTHKGRLIDFDFHPFIDTIVATSSDDCKVNINAFPSDGLTDNVTSPEISITGHKKKVALIKFHPAANNVIASASYDRTIKVWNIENAACIGTMTDCNDNIYSMSWNKDGSLLAATSKDKVLRLYDPRKQDAAMKIDGAFGGIKSSKCFWATCLGGFVGSTGFSKGAKRHLKLWDLRDLEKPVYNQGIDNAASVLIPHMDNDLGILYLAGKGDNSVNYYELRNDSKIMHFLSVYRDGVPQKGGGWVPKRGLSPMKCEVQRFLKLTKDSVIPISFIVPRKAGGDVFQEDIYPNCASARPALTADEWAAGNNANPNTMNMDPEERKEDDGGDVKFTKRKTYDEVVRENMELKQLVQKLQDEIAQLKGTTSDDVKDADKGDDEEDNAGDQDGGDQDGGDQDGGDQDGGDE
jgi:coronin-1B/1C/6